MECFSLIYLLGDFICPWHHEKEDFGFIPYFRIAPTTDFVSTRQILILWYAKGFRAKKKFRFTSLPLTHRHTPLAQSVKSKVVLLHVKILEKRPGLCNPTCFLSLFTKLVGPLRVKGKINRELVWYLAVDRVFILKFFAWTLIVSLYFYLKTDGRFCRGCRSSTILPPQCPVSWSILYVSLHFWKPKVPWELWECPSMWVGLKRTCAILKTRNSTGVNFTFTCIFDYGVI